MRAETNAALAAVEVGLELTRRRVGAVRITSKGGRDLVTDTDVAGEDAIRSTLLGHFPDWTVVGEERGGEDQIGDRPYWLVDPICGTRNFASGLPLYAVNVALVENGQVTVAAVGDGGSGERFSAERGHGAYQLTPDGEQRLRASDDSLVVSVSVGSIDAGSHHVHSAEFMRSTLLANRWDVRMLGTTSVFPYLAAGRIAAFVLFRLSSPVHTAAGCLLAEEAGALVTDLTGAPWTVETRGLVAAASPGLQAALLDGLAATASPVPER
jgi:myo-inositol-1(or 4)-monophosphatase